MSEKNTNNQIPSDPTDRADRYFSQARVPLEKNKSEIWQELESRITPEERPGKPVRRLISNRGWMAVAASLAILLGVTLFMRYYAVETYCPAATHTSLEFPDGSMAEVNAETTLKYHPYWWFHSRTVELDGEAYFQVNKGKPFRVVSANAITEVLGTTFNIYARERTYHVTCHSGSIRVSSSLSGNQVDLLPDERVDLDPSGTLNVTILKKSSSEPGWVNSLITFSSTPFRLVLDEIERQYGIVIEAPEGMALVYSGKFSLDQPVERILSLLCLPFDLEYAYTSGKTYRIYPAKRE